MNKPYVYRRDIKTDFYAWRKVVMILWRIYCNDYVREGSWFFSKDEKHFPSNTFYDRLSKIEELAYVKNSRPI